MGNDAYRHREVLKWKENDQQSSRELSVEDEIMRYRAPSLQAHR